jgi:hypothetical protein
MGVATGLPIGILVAEGCRERCAMTTDVIGAEGA